MWWYLTVNPALKKQRQKDHDFEACVDYLVRPCLKKTKNQLTKQKTENPLEISLLGGSLGSCFEPTLLSFKPGFDFGQIASVCSSIKQA
jgi:hypothetical protein